MSVGEIMGALGEQIKLCISSTGRRHRPFPNFRLWYAAKGGRRCRTSPTRPKAPSPAHCTRARCSQKTHCLRKDCNALQWFKPTVTIGSQIPHLADTPSEINRLCMPTQPNTFDAFGNVINIGSDRHFPSRTAGNYLRLVGGFASGAKDKKLSLIWMSRSIYNSLPVSDFYCRESHVTVVVNEHGITTFLAKKPDDRTWVYKVKNASPAGPRQQLQRVSCELKVGCA